MRWYRLLLHLYPVSFRASYGDELSAVFAARSRDAHGFAAHAALWCDLLADTVVTAARLHADVLIQDLRHTVRSLRRAPGFTVAAVVVASLGIGATTAAFSIADHVITRPFPFPDADRLVKVWQDQVARGYGRMEFSPGNYRDVKAAARSFEAIGAYTEPVTATLTGHGDPVLLSGAALTDDLFGVLGLSPALGRVFTPTDGASGGRAILLSDRMWRRRFGADPNILGRRLRLDGETYAVVGVMPPVFVFPNRIAEFWIPLQFQPADYENRASTWVYSVAKLRRGVTLEAARAELRTIGTALERAFPEQNAKTSATAFLWRDEIPSQSRQLLIALVGAAACVLLIACSNLASLLLTRAGSRERELDVRAALGAGKARLIRQLFTESVVLAAVSGVIGIALAVSVLPLVARLVPNALPIAEVPSVDGRMLAIAALLSVSTALGFGVLPAIRAGRRAGRGMVTAAARTGVSRQTERVRRALVVVQLTVSVVLLVATGLLLRALWTVQATSPGFDAANVMTLRTSLPIPAYAELEARVTFYDRVLGDIRRIPGVIDAGYISALPMVWRGGIWPVEIVGRPQGSATETQSSSLRFATPGFFRAMTIPLAAGREIAASDTPTSQLVAVVSQSFARTYFPDGGAIGSQIVIANRARAIVGIVGDVRVRGLERESEPQVYLPAAQHIGAGFFYVPKDLAVKSSLPMSTLEPRLREIIRRVEPELPITDLRPLADVIVADTATRAVQLRVLGAFAAIALLLAGVGIHGLLGFYVATRSREIGLRVALGAQRGDVVSLITRQTLLLAGAGLAAGIGLALLVAQSLRTMLAGVAPADAATFAVAAGTCVVMMAIGSALPIRRALKLDPVRLIRSE
ncbi:MAG TPA: ABC transporter permease [Vicinamibacterales bacterium]|nr:ABC transporter permease [Vicinamibacterales bacterium]